MNLVNNFKGIAISNTTSLQKLVKYVTRVVNVDDDYVLGWSNDFLVQILPTMITGYPDNIIDAKFSEEVCYFFTSKVLNWL